MKKKILAIAVVCLMMTCVSVFAQDDVMKISMAGDTVKAKDIGTGKGVTFTLPELKSEEFYIYAIELAVFEKQDGESNWHIYTDEKGSESKKHYIEKPNGLTFNVDFGNPEDYRYRAKYKIGYRYYVQCVYDTSKIFVAGEELKDGWRLVGEENADKASKEGFMFYKNTLPELQVECFTYKYHDMNGLMTMDCSVSELSKRYFPSDAFENGITVQMIANDFDGEDVLTASFRLEDAITDEVLMEGPLSTGDEIKTTHRTDVFRMYITVTDNFGGSVTTEPFLFMMDRENAVVTSEFYDGGFAIRGGNLFSDFYIADDPGYAMTEGSVYADIYLENAIVASLNLENRGNGVFRLDKTGMPDGRYTVQLKIYDKAGNASEHTFYQTLDNTAPEVYFVTPEENSDATYYSKWMNESKKVIIDITDEYAGLRNGKLYCDNKLIANSSSGLKVYRYILTMPVDKTKTGKLNYRFNVYDYAKMVNKNTNAYEPGNGNSRMLSKSVWIDKTKPTIVSSHEDDSWHESPYNITASFYDYPSSDSVNDASGVKEKMYAVTTYENEEPVWQTYTDGVAITDGGLYYVHFKATDYAGNVTTLVQKVCINSGVQIKGRVRPTEEYKHTLYYNTPGFYVVKNTAYNTKYHFEVTERDTDDSIKTTVKLVSQDDRSVFGISESISPPVDTEERDIVFNMPYLDSELNELPDGVYDMLITITEIKTYGEMIVTYTGVKDCEIVIKRNSPPTPQVNVDGDKVNIIYPDETLAGSLNNPIVKSHYKCQYKTVKDGEPETNVYKTYTGEFDVDDFIVTALYTDIAGNTSVATKRIYGDSDANGREDENIITGGNTITVEESRSADVYYIGIRRDKNNGINNNVFDFLE